ncbi:histidinol phosphate phosphatase domain-containing protein [Elusimicrobiota bacterium]
MMDLIDLHTHTFFSDGVLSPAELVYRYKTKGCSAVALTDHADYSNIDIVIPAMIRASEKLAKHYGIDVFAGIELTYIPPDDIGSMIKYARSIGAQIIVIHGETSAENVPPGTNRSAVLCGCDILAHPGYLNNETANIAAQENSYLEITTRSGHRNTNKEVYETAVRNNAKLVLNTDTHTPENLLDREKIDSVIKQCGMNEDYYEVMNTNSRELCSIIKERIQ